MKMEMVKKREKQPINSNPNSLNKMKILNSGVLGTTLINAITIVPTIKRKLYYPNVWRKEIVNSVIF